MPKELMEQIEKLQSMTGLIERGLIIEWDFGAKNFRVFVGKNELLPEGEPTYESYKRGKKWFKYVTVNGVKYTALLSQEEYEAEVA